MAAKKKSQKKPGEVAIYNKKARHDYEIADSFEVGIVLTGAEVKAVRAAAVQLKESYVKVSNSECFLVGCHISPYQFASEAGYDPIRTRKLLLHKRQIEKLQQQIEAGLSEEEIKKSWKLDLVEFKKIRAKYLLYD